MRPCGEKAKMPSVEQQYQNEIDELREQLAAKDAEIATIEQVVKEHGGLSLLSLVEAVRHIANSNLVNQQESERLRAALQQARILLDGLGHHSVKEAHLTEKIDKVIREALAASPPAKLAQSIYLEIGVERTAQDAQWGGSMHDDSHERFEWCEYIRKQNNSAVSSSHNPEVFEQRMVKVAALAVAAIESSRRQRG